jgi:hypothetical protein
MPVFQGRLADGTASNTCTASGATRCTSFYDSHLNVTILNNWNIGKGFWSATAAAGSAQALAESAGLAATGLTGWVLPTADGTTAASGLNQLFSIWSDSGGTLTGLPAQFDGVQTDVYWSGAVYSPDPSFAWSFYTGLATEFVNVQSVDLYAVAVRPGDVVASVPEPPTLALVLAGLGAACLVRWHSRAAPPGSRS